MNILVFDTETTSLDKPFCYNIGYVVVDASNWTTLVKRDFVVEQVWRNLPLFQSAYYADKRPIYVERMRSHKVIMDKFGYICRQLSRDIKTFEIENAYAYNSPFDEKVFDFNCEWFKVINPFETLKVHDIRGYVHNFLIDEKFFDFCEKNNEFTENGNYSTRAETVFRYISENYDFEEEHTALSDSVIEAEILQKMTERGANIEIDYQVLRSIERKIERTLHIKTAEQTDYYFNYSKIRVNRERTEITLR